MGISAAGGKFGGPPNSDPRLAIRYQDRYDGRALYLAATWSGCGQCVIIVLIGLKLRPARLRGVIH